MKRSDCKYGDSVMMEKTVGEGFGMFQMTFTGYQVGQCSLIKK